MALDLGGGGAGFARSVRRGPVLGGRGQNPQMLAALQQLFRNHVGGGRTIRRASPVVPLGPGMPTPIPGGVSGIPEGIPGITPGAGSGVGDPGPIPKTFPPPWAGGGGDPSGPPILDHPPGLIPGMGLIPMPDPQPIGRGDLRRGLLELLHPNIRGIIGGKKAIPGNAIGGSVPQNNRRIAIPPTGAFHHTAASANGLVPQARLDLRRQHIQDVQAQAGQMANMIRKSRAMGPAPRRAIPAGY